METLRRIFAPVFACFLTLYFVYHIFQGERGFIAYLKMTKKVKEDEQFLNDLSRQKETLEKRVNLLRPENLDTDLLEEIAKKTLNYRDQAETVMIDPKPKHDVKKPEGIES